MNFISWRRLRALCWKETLQIFRDPSSILIAFFMPLLMLFIFGYGINLDFSRLADRAADRGWRGGGGGLRGGANGSPWLEVHSYDSRAALERALVDSQIRGFVVIPQDFSRKLKQAGETAPVQLAADGTEPNIAQFVRSTVNGVWQTWQMQRAEDRGEEMKREIIVRAAGVVQPVGREPEFHHSRLDHRDHDGDWRAAHLAGGGAGMGAWHDGGAAGLAGDADGIVTQQDPAVLRAGHGFADAVRGGGALGVAGALPRDDSPRCGWWGRFSC